MGKHLKCVIKESKTNAVALGRVLRHVPTMLVAFTILFTPLVIAVIIRAFDYPHQMNTETVLVTLSLSSILWGIFIGYPILDRIWISPEKKLGVLFTHQIHAGIKLIYDACLAIPRFVAAIIMIMLPSVVFISWGFITQQFPFQIGDWELIILFLSTLVWGILIGFPVVECYLYPSSVEVKGKDLVV